jgi:hypothetical protein
MANIGTHSSNKPCPWITKIMETESDLERREDSQEEQNMHLSDLPWERKKFLLRKSLEMFQ